MCRLFGFRSAVLSRAHRSLTQAENALAIQARDHRDGWGIGWYHGGEAYLIKSEQGAAGSDSFARASERLASHTFVVHVRRATVGEISPFNVHPFRHGRWLFAHNGTIFGFPGMSGWFRDAIPAHLRDNVLGSTDTETLFFFLLARLERAGIDPFGVRSVTTERLGAALGEGLEALHQACDTHGCPRPVANFILTNGRVFAANRSGRELYYATQKQTCRDHGHCTWPDKICMLPDRPGDRVNHLLVASEKIGDEDRWHEVPEGTMVLLSEDYRLQLREVARKQAEAAVEQTA